MQKIIDLSIVVLSYNTTDLLKDCLESLEKVKEEADFEVIVVDNDSNDGSPQMLRKEFPEVYLIQKNKNVGFAAGNNSARKSVKSKYVLFLNSDTIVNKNTLKETLKYLQNNKDVGALTCKLVLPNGGLDKDARRSFITPWVGLTHLILKLDKLFPNSRLFGQYWYGYESPETTHEVDVIQGAYFLTTKKVLDDVGWFDEDYFLDGEDIDICWKIKQTGKKIIYYPVVSTIHVKGASKGKRGSNNNVSKSEKVAFRTQGVRSMEIFYKKHMWDQYPLLLNYLVILGIRVMLAIRVVTTYILG